ncbi:MAG: hypothetical protein WCG93_10925 [Paludibacter sp.]
MIVGTIDAPTAVNSVSDNSTEYVCFSKEGRIILESKTKFDSASVVSIFDANARMICKEKLVNQMYSPKVLPKGFYTVQVSGKSKSNINKVIINQ